MKDKQPSKSRFPWILGATALFIALCAACFSVYGIATLFAGATISVMVMASSLEIGKLVATTFLYRYWEKCQRFLKTYLVIAVLALLVITSLGIFGYLSAAYQKSSIEFAVAQDRIKTVESQKAFYQDKIVAAKKRSDDLGKLRSSQEARMSEVLTNEFLSRNPIQLKQLQQQTVDLISQTDKDMKEQNDKIQTSIEDIRKIDEQVNQLKLGSAEKKDIQTFKFVADALGLSLDTVARWFIISIIFVFDPLAICLILAYNVAVYRKEDERVYDNKPIQPSDTKTLLTDAETSSVPEPIVPIVLPNTESPVNSVPILPPVEEPEKTKNTFFNQYFKR
jgi:hypothetical protein